MSLHRVAPRQRRTARSLRRFMSRLTNRAVTFAHAINSTHADAPSSVYSRRRDVTDQRENKGAGLARVTGIKSSSGAAPGSRG